MKILLVTRGSNGDILPYLHLASSLEKRGYDVHLNLPKVFEKEVIPYQLKYSLQNFEDINDMVKQADQEGKSFGVKTFLEWVKASISAQFEQLVPLVEDCDVFVSTNTEFAASSIAEYCNKPFLRTAFAPFLPGKKIPPPLQPYTKENTFLVPIIWKLLNGPTDLMMSGALNKQRKAFGMEKIKSVTKHGVGYAHNVLLYSQHLGNVDPQWKWKWDIAGYSFNDSFQYNQESYQDFIKFVRKDDRQNLFFTFGSCTSKNGDQFATYLADIAKKHNYKLIIGSGWSNTGANLEDEHIHVLKNAIPHNLIFPECKAVVHHGGTGTTHNASRHGKPQLLAPLFLDQYYWGKRIHEMGLGPLPFKLKKCSFSELEEKVVDIMTNKSYLFRTTDMAYKMSTENPIEKFCDILLSMKDPRRKAV